MNIDLGEFKDVRTFSNTTFIVLMSFSVFTILLGMCGMSCFFKPCVTNRGWTITFGILLMFVWLVITIFGFVITAISTNGAELMQAYCDGQITGSKL